MKTISELSINELRHDELMNINGGSEFSESVARGIGWFVGGVVSIFESAVRAQVDMEARGIHVNHF